MSNPIPTDLSAGLPSGQSTNKIASSVSCYCAEGSPKADFKDILADETLSTEVLAELKKALPEDLITQIEDMMESGNGLPLAAIFSPESPLFNFPKVMQDVVKLDGSAVSPIAASVLKIGESMQKHGADVAGRVLNTLGHQINEALSTVSSDSRGAGFGKQIQDLLLAAKAEFTATDIGPRAFISTATGSEGSVTPTATINSAISGLAQLPSFQASGGSPLPPAIAAPLGEEGWGQAMGERIMWMLGKGIQAASIRINPPNLGPIQVQLSVQNDQASVNMLVQHGVVKEALEAAMPRLREMLNESNLQLVNVDVSHRESLDQSSRSALFNQDQREQMKQFLQDQELATTVEEEIPRYYRSTGLLDDYA